MFNLAYLTNNQVIIFMKDNRRVIKLAKKIIGCEDPRCHI